MLSRSRIRAQLVASDSRWNTVFRLLKNRRRAGVISKGLNDQFYIIARDLRIKRAREEDDTTSDDDDEDDKDIRDTLEGEGSDLPRDMLYEIFLNMPIQQLYMSRSLSKDIAYLIDTQVFPRVTTIDIRSNEDAKVIKLVIDAGIRIGVTDLRVMRTDFDGGRFPSRDSLSYRMLNSIVFVYGKQLKSFSSQGFRAHGFSSATPPEGATGDYYDYMPNLTSISLRPPVMPYVERTPVLLSDKITELETAFHFADLQSGYMHLPSDVETWSIYPCDGSPKPSYFEVIDSVMGDDPDDYLPYSNGFYYARNRAYDEMTIQFKGRNVEHLRVYSSEYLSSFRELFGRANTPQVNSPQVDFAADFPNLTSLVLDGREWLYAPYTTSPYPTSLQVLTLAAEDILDGPNTPFPNPNSHGKLQRLCLYDAVNGRGREPRPRKDLVRQIFDTNLVDSIDELYVEPTDVFEFNAGASYPSFKLGSQRPSTYYVGPLPWSAMRADPQPGSDFMSTCRELVLPSSGASRQYPRRLSFKLNAIDPPELDRSYLFSVYTASEDLGMLDDLCLWDVDTLDTTANREGARDIAASIQYAGAKRLYLVNSASVINHFDRLTTANVSEVFVLQAERLPRPEWVDTAYMVKQQINLFPPSRDELLRIRGLDTIGSSVKINGLSVSELRDEMVVD